MISLPRTRLANSRGKIPNRVPQNDFDNVLRFSEDESILFDKAEVADELEEGEAEEIEFNDKNGHPIISKSGKLSG
jgi:hypothetical protein